MTLSELMDLYRPHLADASVGVRRSWEETFKYTLKHYPPTTPLEDFSLDILAQKMATSGIHRQFVDGYIKRWRDLLAKKGDLQAL